ALRRASCTSARSLHGRAKARHVGGKLSSETFAERFARIVSHVGKVMKGKDAIVGLCLIGMLAEGHVLFEDMPGTGKTMLARSISQTLHATTSRIQCTPDLLPADVTGSTVLVRKTGDFVFRRGPVFAHVFLADALSPA